MSKWLSSSVTRSAALLVIGLLTVACGESERTDAQAKENIAKYTAQQKQKFGDFSPFFISGEILKLCVKANAVSPDLLEKYEANKNLLFLKLKEEDPETSEVVLDSEAVSKGLMSERANQLTANDCNQAINVLRPFGFFADSN